MTFDGKSTGTGTIIDPSDLQAVGERMLSLVTGVLRALELYELNNATVQSLISGMVELVEQNQEVSGGGLCLLQDGENIFCNMEFLRLERRTFDKVKRLITAFERLRVNQIELQPDCTVDTLTLFFGKVVQALAKPEDEELREALANDAETKACMDLVEGISKKGQGEEDREDISLRMFATLTLLTREYVLQTDKLTFPPTVRVRRILQRLVDLMDTHGDYILGLINQGTMDGSLHGHLTRSALLAAALARTTGMERRRIARVAVGVYLSHLPLARLGDDWATADQDQLGYVFEHYMTEAVNRGNFNERTARHLSILHELQTSTLRKGAPYGADLDTSFDGKIAAISVLFDRLRTGLTGAGNDGFVGPATAVAKLADIGRAQKDLAQPHIDWRLVAMLVRLMGTLPPGTLVRLPDNSIGVVRGRPQVIRIADSSGRPLDAFQFVNCDKASPLDAPESLDITAAVGWPSPPEEPA